MFICEHLKTLFSVHSTGTITNYFQELSRDVAVDEVWSGKESKHCITSPLSFLEDSEVIIVCNYV